MKYYNLREYSLNILFSYFLIGILVWIWWYNIIGDVFLSLIIISFISIIGFIISLRFRQIISSCIVLGTGIICGLWYSSNAQIERIINSKQIDTYYGLYNSYEGEVLKVYKRSDFYDEYVINVEKIEQEVFWQDLLHLLRVPKNFVLEPRQHISYQWVMYPLEDFDGFAYQSFMLSQWIYFSTSTTTIDHISHNTDSITYKMYVMREKLLENISDIFPSRESIFLWWILFWARENIPQELKEDFNNSGLTHFIAVSWFNITLCIIFMTYVFAFFPVYIRAVLVITSIVAFSFFVWLWAPVVRAAIMGILWYIFLQSWNTSNTLTLIAFTAVVMSLISPLSLNYDVSMHLSFLAVIGIIYTQEIFTKIFSWIPSTFAIREAFVLTLSALSFSLPVMMFQFGQISLLAPLANIAVTWTIPLAMLWWTVTLIADMISPVIWQWLWFITWILLRYDIAMVEFFGNIEWALLRVDFWAYANYLQVLYFIVLIYILALYHLQKKTSEKQSETTISKLKLYLLLSSLSLTLWQLQEPLVNFPLHS